jgi:hypothetical protein
MKIGFINIIILSFSLFTFTACEYDTEAPVVKAVAPKTKKLIENRLESLVYSATDNKLGVWANSLKITINENDATALGKLGDGSLTIEPTKENPLPEGEFTVSITLADLIDNRATTKFTYTCDNGLDR